MAQHSNVTTMSDNKEVEKEEESNENENENPEEEEKIESRVKLEDVKIVTHEEDEESLFKM